MGKKFRYRAVMREPMACPDPLRPRRGTYETFDVFASSVLMRIKADVSVNAMK
ncbi:hypothetical protein [Actinospica robiniae]|uniref:hypothetical protein n=1 Tax=Actinospica robiniae TaxID=304901 RepID=UPI0012F8CD9F|nr:hypothetical protein [Actinospica robiniae]